MPRTSNFGIRTGRFARLFFVTLFLTGAAAFAQTDFWQPANGPYEGYTRAFAINKTTGAIFAGTFAGGVMRSLDNGDNWMPVNNNGLTLSQYALAINDRGDIFSGTSGGGMFRSTNNGDSWSQINTGLTILSIRSLVINSRGEIFAGTINGGLFRSINNGDTWTSANHGLPNQSVLGLGVNASGHLFAATSAGLYRSIDNGANWIFITPNLPQGATPALHITAQGYIWVAITGVIYRSTDNGANFIPFRKGLPVTSFTALVTNSQGDVFASAVTSNIEFAAGLYRLKNDDSTWTVANSGLTNHQVRALAFNAKGDLFAGTNIGVFRSSDNAASWTRISNKDFLANYIYSLAANPDPATPGLFAGTYGGVFRSQDKGATWTLVDKGWPGTTAYSVFIDAPRRQIFAGVAASGVYRSKDNGESWSPANKGLLGAGTAFVTNSRGDIFAGTIENGMYRSTDNAENWTPINNGLTNNKSKSINPNALVMNATNEYIFAGTDSSVFRSTNNGDTWTALTNGLPSGSCYALVINTSGHIFAGFVANPTSQSGVYRSLDNGASWTRVNVGGSTFALAINANGVVFQGTAAAVFRSKNNGQTWNGIASGLKHPFIPSPFTVNSLVVDADGFIYAGAERGGVHRSAESTNNRPPVVINPISNQNLAVGGAAYRQSLRTVFNDADGDSLTYIATSSNVGKAQASITGANLTVTAVAGGAATITVTANDAFGGAASTTFVVTVGNRQPFVARVIPNQNLAGSGVKFTENLRTVFKDPDGDALKFNANSSAANIAGASLADSILTVTGIARGSATITVTATDETSQLVATTFTVTVANSAPKLANAIADTTITLGASTFTRNLNTPAVFIDTDGDALTYTAISSASNIATAIISGSRLTVTPVDGGKVVITVAANDGQGGTFSASFVITVNRPPRVANRILDQFVTLGPGATFTRNLNVVPFVFIDPDGDTLKYAARSSDQNIATATVSGTVLTVTPVAAGRATITITANDRRGGEFTTTFTAIVNRAPVPANSIPAQIRSINEAPFTRDLNATPAIFSDSDGDTLRYSARSSALNVATVTITGSTLTVAAVGLGNTTITVTADDRRGGTASTSFLVNVVFNKPPVVSSTPPLPKPNGETITVPATITDDKPNYTAKLYYRRAGDNNFNDVAMTGTGAVFQAAILGFAGPPRGMEYYVVAKDSDSDTTRFPNKGALSIPVKITNEARATAQPFGSEQTAYRLLSVPFQLDDPAAAKVLEDDLSSYNPELWRLFGLLSGQPLSNLSPYAEFPNAGAFSAGQSLFLIVHDAAKNVDAGPGQTARTDQEFAIPLASGHNFIATPFNFMIPLRNLKLKSGSALNLRTYQGNWIAATEMAPWEGYYLPNNLSTNDTLLVNPNLSSSSVPVAQNHESRWRIQILASCEQARDTENFAEVAVASAPDWDMGDFTEAPPIGEYVSVYFPHPEWQKPAIDYCIDSRPEISSGAVWEFEVLTNIRDKVNLSFEGIQRVPPELQVWLMDEALHVSQNLREKNQYAVVAGVERRKSLQLVVGREDFIAAQLAKVQTIPQVFELAQNFPNPFNPATTIRYGLPRAERVSLKVFNLRGEEVVTLVDDEIQNAGYHLAIWDGRNQAGQVVSSGVYFYHFRAGDFSMMKKAALMK